jgi:hypothetical protein
MVSSVGFDGLGVEVSSANSSSDDISNCVVLFSQPLLLCSLHFCMVPRD